MWFDSQKIFSLLQKVQTGSGAHPAAYSMGPGSLFVGFFVCSNTNLQKKKVWLLNF
jgi:hypothetical protein